MEDVLNEVQTKMRLGQHKNMIGPLQILIETYANDDQIYQAYGFLGDCYNFMGEHEQAVQSWTKALKILDETAENFDQLSEAKRLDWFNISLKMARVMHRQGNEGSGVSHQQNRVTYTSSKLSKADEEQWKNDHLHGAIEHYRRVIDRLSPTALEAKRKFRLELAEILLAVGNSEEAGQIYEDAFNNDGNPEWIYKAAECSWQQGKKEQAFTRLQQLIETEPRFAPGYELCAKYFMEKNETSKAEEYTRLHRFYSWVPKFCQHIDYNEENFSLRERIGSDQALQCIETVLVPDQSRRSTEFLATACHHHYHGPVENRAFQELENRGKTQDNEEKQFIGSILMSLLTNHQSVCTIKGATNALAGMKHEGLFDILARLLPQDLNMFFPMGIPHAMAKLGDPRAIPLLIEMIEHGSETDNGSGDSSDDFMTSGGRRRLVSDCYLALSTFIDDPTMKEFYNRGFAQRNLREMSLAVLGVRTNNQKYLHELEQKLAQGNALDHQVVRYLEKHVDKSPAAMKLLKLNEQVTKKRNIKNENTVQIQSETQNQMGKNTKTTICCSVS